MEHYDRVMQYLREVNLISIFLRLTIATICAGIIGVDRGRKRRPAGFRTHILVCVGAALVMITSQYMSDVMKNISDVSRMGAQVISGIGFLGAGTIIVVGRNQVKGLTTAAGLWACACMGLAVGIGFYEGAIIGCLFLYGVMTGLHNIDNYVQSNSKVMEIYVELEDMAALTRLIKALKDKETRVSNVEVQKIKKQDNYEVMAMMTLRLAEKMDHREKILEINEYNGILAVEEIS